MGDAVFFKGGALNVTSRGPSTGRDHFTWHEFARTVSEIDAPSILNDYVLPCCHSSAFLKQTSPNGPSTYSSSTLVRGFTSPTAPRTRESQPNRSTLSSALPLPRRRDAKRRDAIAIEGHAGQHAERDDRDSRGSAQAGAQA